MVALKKITIDENEKLVLYRGCEQGKFEGRVIEGMVKKGHAKYWGTGGCGRSWSWTFCTYHPGFAMWYSQNRSTEYVKNRILWEGTILSRHPLIMAIEINGKKYGNRLYQGDGIGIRGPIGLEDITVLFGAHIDKLEKIPLNFVDIYGRKGDLNPTRWREKIEEMRETSKKDIFSKTDLVDRMIAEEEDTIKKLAWPFYRTRLGKYTNSELMRIRKALEILKTKLR